MTSAEVTMPSLAAAVEGLHGTCVGRGTTPVTAALKIKGADSQGMAAHVASFAVPADQQQSAGVEGEHARDERGAGAVDAVPGIGNHHDAPIRHTQAVNPGGERHPGGGGGGSDAAAAAVQLKNAVKALRAASVAASARSVAEQDAGCRVTGDVVVEQTSSTLLETWHILISPLYNNLTPKLYVVNILEH